MAKPSAERQSKPARQVFFEHLVPNRECGDCVACCKVLEINWPELRKPADILCHHNTGTGCGIHLTRPAGCRAWFCLWRRIDEMPEHLRPDRCGVVFSVDRHDPPRNVFERIYIVARAIDDPTALQSEPVKAALEMFTDEGSLPVWTSFQGTKSLYYPAFHLADAIARPETTPWQSLVVAALAWRKRYGLD
jgi:hypothetical protein